ncbi:hypothetical protein A2U01_0016981 [Trifolium medium]|uniref:DUF7745 domain-containing protein n=1 Tax=Trifolium medium TaxID=97028 RepID=A0A392NAC1_9FABA|nr:hypothetical protein [Trifolium medium]
MRKDFDDKYGKILSLMEVNVQVEAITALSQFYDPPYRCFTFQDFQMAPTLEEYEQILGFPLENSKPYHYIGHYPSLSTVASILKVNKGQLSAVMKNPNCADGIPLAYLKERLNLFHKEQDWTAFTDVLALTIFGIVLFPNMDEYVDFAAIDVFLAVRNQGHNPVPAVLADTYCVLNSCHEMKKKRILCCLPALYVWLITHIFHGVRRASSCPIVDFKECFVKDKSKQDWAKYLRNLNERTVRWYPKWREVNKR